MLNRKDFLRSIIGSSAFLAMPYQSYSKDHESILKILEDHTGTSLGSMYGYKNDPIKKVRVGIIGLGNRGNTLLEMFRWSVEHGDAEIAALCDLDAMKAEKAAEKLGKWQRLKPNLYSGDENAWKKLAQQDNIDLLLITTPWRWHTPMAIYGMNQGKHVASEVPIAYTLSDCWALISLT